MEKSLPIEFRIAGIDTKQFAVIEEAYNQEEEVIINVGLQFSIQPKKRGIGVHFNLQFKHANTIFIQLETACFFEINPIGWNALLEKNENTIKLPKGLAEHLSVITVGTTRGILYEKLRKKTPFDQFILPAINLSHIVKDDVQLKME